MSGEGKAPQDQQSSKVFATLMVAATERLTGLGLGNLDANKYLQMLLENVSLDGKVSDCLPGSFLFCK